jgi:D-beta-D-heptose 7-phosphate kinase/D-beta-D-heptose 1-phosphate adenosyltransferase
MWPELIDRLDALQSPTVLVVGDYMLDRYLYGEAERISPEAPVPILREVNQEERPGAAGSVVAQLAAFEARVLCCGAVGADLPGDRLLELLGEIGADTSGLIRTSDRRTTEKTRLVGLAQHRHPQQIARIDAEETSPFSQDDEDRLLDAVQCSLSQADLVCLQDHRKGVLSSSVCARIIKMAREASKPVLADPALLRDYSKYQGVTCITPNRYESEELVGRSIRNESEAAQAATDILDLVGSGAVIITLDKDGAYLAQRGGFSGLIETQPQPVVDVTSAGDVMIATLALTAGSGWDWPLAVRTANVACGLEVRRYGAVPVTRQEIVDDLLGRVRLDGGKVRPLNELGALLRQHQNRGHRIVYTNGCFDILHRGHVHLLQQCRSHGDVLVVGLNGDKSVRALGKGGNRPINSESDRAAMLAALECIDYVVIFDDPDPLDCIKSVSPDVLVKGEDWRDKGVIGREFVESRGGKVVLVDLLDGYSTSAIVDRLSEGASGS